MSDPTLALEGAADAPDDDVQSLIAPLRAQAVAYSKATARATVQAIPSLLAAVRFKPFTHVIDIACGPGHGAGAASALGAKALGVDISFDMVAVARSRHPTANFKIADAASLGEADDRFDAAICNFAVAHFEDPAAALAEAFRVLKPGARIAFTSWLGPEASPFFGAVADVAEKLAAEGADLAGPPVSPDAFQLSRAEECVAALSAAGFIEHEVSQVPIVYTAPDGDFLALLDDLALPNSVPREDAPEFEPLRAALNARMADFRARGRYEIPMPAAMAMGRKPAA